MFSRSLRALVLIAVIATVCAFGFPGFAAHGQDEAGFDPVGKSLRDLPFPPPLAAGPETAAAAAPAVLPQVIPQPVEAAGTPQEEAAAGPANDVSQWTKLAYQSFRKDNWEIYLANGDGSLPFNLTQDRSADARPQLNREATRVTFHSDRAGNVEVYTVNADGSGLNRLTFNHAADFAPTWSPDSGRIVFVSDRTGNNELFVMNADGSALTQLTFDAGSDSSPAWSPDGKWIAWKRTYGAASSILMMHPDSSELTQLASGLVYAGNLGWSPDSSKLVADADIDGDYWNELIQVRYQQWQGWVVEPLADANQSFIDLWAGAYAPDGDSVAFSLAQYGVKDRKLYLQAANLLRGSLSSGETTVINGFGADIDPSWANIDWLAPASQVAPLSPFVHAGRVQIHLEGADSGPSGIRSYDVQIGASPDGPWWDFVSGLAGADPYLPSLKPGTSNWLRARATDYAGNVEAWPSTADTGAQVYAWDVRGRGVDNRGVPVPNGVMASSPDAFNSISDKNGGYQLLYTGEQTYTVGMTAPGYRVGDPSALNLNADIRLDLFLPPTTELLPNGGFEEGLVGWTGDGVLAQGGPADGAHSGSRGLLLGSDCAVHCLEGPVSVNLPHRGWTAQAVDAQGNFHLIQGDGGQLHYTVRSLATGVWSEPEIVPLNLPASNSYVHVVALAVDGGGTVHVATLVHTPGEAMSVAYSEYTLWYGQKALGGDWTPFTRIAADIELIFDDIVMKGDPIAGVHLLIEHRVYFRRTASGTWSPAVDMLEGMSMLNVPYTDLAVSSDGVVHFVANPDDMLIYRSLSPQGDLSTPLVIGPASIRSYGMLDIAAGPSGTVHIAGGPSYSSRNEAGFWTNPRLISPDGRYSSYELQVDGAGRLHAFSQFAFPPTAYWLPTADTGWSAPHLLDPDIYLGTYYLTVSPGGVIQLLSSNSTDGELSYWSSPLGSTGVISTVSHAVTLPAQMVHPTLSFFHKALTGDPQGQARLSVTVDDGVGATTVYSSAAAVGWTQGFVDMEAWLGKTVTVTFAVEQADAEPLLAVYLDDISLGPWTTPVIRDVTPAQLYGSWDGAQITVRGDNFTGGSTLRLGDTPLPAALIDEHTLSATIPPGLAAGRYDLWVQNPEGQQNVLGAGLTLGGWGYLPVVRK